MHQPDDIDELSSRNTDPRRIDRRDHFGAIASQKLRLNPKALPTDESRKPRPPGIEDIENLEPKLRRLKNDTEFGFTQDEFNTMLEVGITQGFFVDFVNDHAYDRAIDAIFDTFGSSGAIDVCGAGSFDFVVW